MQVWSVKSLLNGWIKDWWCKNERVRERERKGERVQETKRRDTEVTKDTKIQKKKNNRYICDCDFWRETLVCEESTFCPERSTVLATFRDPFDRTKLWRTILILAYPTIEAFLFLLYLDNLIEPETHTSGSWPEDNLLSSTVLHQTGFVMSVLMFSSIINSFHRYETFLNKPPLIFLSEEFKVSFNRASDDPWNERRIL